MAQPQKFITEEGRERLMDELRELRAVRRPGVAERIRAATDQPAARRTTPSMKTPRMNKPSSKAESKTSSGFSPTRSQSAKARTRKAKSKSAPP